jgi:hypothetical protein
MTGIPSGRRLPLAPRFGMYTRLTGRALNSSAACSILSTNLALASGVSTTSPSTPAVMRPALRSVTRRTLTSVFERERNMSFCRLRTLLRSPACDAVKIRCRSRRTSASTRRQSIRRQSKGASSGPFTATLIAASNLSSGSGASVIFFSTGSPDRVSALSRPGTRPGIRPVIRHNRLEEPTIGRGFPSPFGRRRSLLGHPVPAEDLGPPCGRLTGRAIVARTPTGLPRSARVSCDRDGSPLYPEDDGAHPAKSSPCPAPAALPRPALQPRSNIPSCEAPFNEASTRIHAINPGRSSPRLWPPGWNGPPLGFPPSFAPRRPRADDARRGGDRPSSTDLELLAQHHISRSSNR